jgi:hypothetical protein
VQRVALVLAVAVVALSVSGAASLLVPEPCQASQGCSTDEGSCPPTCATCGCCAHGVEPAALVVSDTPAPAGWHTPSLVPSRVLAASLDILHVPRRVRA